MIVMHEVTFKLGKNAIFYSEQGQLAFIRDIGDRYVPKPSVGTARYRTTLRRLYTPMSYFHSVDGVSNSNPVNTYTSDLRRRLLI